MRTFLGVLLCGVLLMACSSQSDHHSPFYRTYIPKEQKYFSSLVLYRDTNTGIPVTYTGYIAESPAGRIIALSGTPSDPADPSRFTLYSGGQDSSITIRASLSADEEDISATILKYKNDKVTDSGIVKFSMADEHPQMKYFSSSSVVLDTTKRINHRITLSFLWPVSEKAFPDEAAITRKRILRELNISKDTSADPVADFYKLNKVDTFPGMSEHSLSMRCIYEGSKHRVYIKEESIAESGMMHPQWSSAYTIIENKSGRKLFLSDVLNENQGEKAKESIHSALKKKYNIPADGSLSKAGFYSNNIPLARQYYFTDTHIHFHYNNYELGPFALGEQDIVIPFSELGGRLEWPLIETGLDLNQLEGRWEVTMADNRTTSKEQVLSNIRNKHPVFVFDTRNKEIRMYENDKEIARNQYTITDENTLWVKNDNRNGPDGSFRIMSLDSKKLQLCFMLNRLLKPYEDVEYNKEIIIQLKKI